MFKWVILFLYVYKQNSQIQNHCINYKETLKEKENSEFICHWWLANFSMNFSASKSCMPLKHTCVKTLENRKQ